MSIALITGANGLVGAEAALHFGALGMDVVGLDNDMRSVFFGSAASTADVRNFLAREPGSRYVHHDVDVRDRDAVLALGRHYGPSVELVIHAAAQPSHDWAALYPFVDFDINAVGTLNLLETVRLNAPEAVFIFCSTNKVYGDAPNHLPLIELETRWEVDSAHPYANGIPEGMSIDSSLHSVFGASKVAADVLVQEYGRYFGMRTACFRAGTLTGPRHAAAEMHGFLAYVMRCAMSGESFTIHGYGGKQVRDTLDSRDLVSAFHRVYNDPGNADVYNIGGGRANSVSVLEAISLCSEVAGRELDVTYSERSRRGDHIWWISDTRRFESRYPGWNVRYGVDAILRDIYDGNVERWAPVRQERTEKRNLLGVVEPDGAYRRDVRA